MIPSAPILSVAVMLLLSNVALATPPGAASSNALPPGVSLKLPPDHVYEHPGAPDSAVTFSHATHVDYESNRCTGCHPKVFRILGPTDHLAHADMNAGKSCGTCHDGKHAFDVRANESCASCHAGRRARPAAGPDSTGAAPGAFSGPLPFAFKAGSASPGHVTFRHTTHAMTAKLRCSNCHPSHWAMKPLVQDPNADWHERSACGSCHDGKKSFSTDDDNACPRCHVEGKARK